jgi:hypothetical protein
MKIILSSKELVLITVIGSAISSVAVWSIAVFVHSSPLITGISLVVVLPYMVLAQWGRELSDWAFWGAFIVIQAGYIAGVYLLARRLIRRMYRV